MRHTSALRSVFDAALAAVDPHAAVVRALRVEQGMLKAGDSVYDRNAFEHVIVVGAGKAVAAMAAAAEEVFGEQLVGGIVVVKYGHGGRLERTEQIEAAHPIPDEAGLEGTRRIIDLVRRADERTLVICLISGGGSALLVAPLPGISLADKQRTTDLLLKAGATIDELNTVRKHLSAVKGGRLAQLAYPATMVTLILSDVIGDRLDVIASGPTSPDSSTFVDATAVIEKFGLATAIPAPVAAFLERGQAGLEPETVRSGSPCFLKTTNVIVGSIARAIDAAEERAQELGWPTQVLTAELGGEAREAAAFLARTAGSVRNGLQSGERACLLSGGETTVTVTGNGSGGRNQELALAFAMEVAGGDGVTLLSAGTDGNDGPTDAAGAVVDGGVIGAARAAGIDAEGHLANHDSYTFFRLLDSHAVEAHQVITGPTGTNVMDMQIMMIEAP